MTWQTVGDHWERDDGRRIRKVNPRGMTLYALTVPGERRPRWHYSLEDAKRDE